MASVNAGTGVVTAIAPGQAAIVASSGSVSGQATVTVTPAPVTGTFRVAFARGSTCHSDSQLGCDLFVTDVNLTTRQAGVVTLVAGEANVTEAYPTLSSSGRFVVYTRIAVDGAGAQTHELYAADLEKKTAGVRIYRGGKFPSFTSDDRKLFFSRDTVGGGDIWVADVVLDAVAGSVTLGTPTRLTSPAMGFVKAEDPTAVGATGSVAFHYLATASSQAAAGYLAFGATTFTPLSESAGHIVANSAGNAIAVSSSVGSSLGVIRSAGAGWSARQNVALPTAPAFFSSDDARFGAVSLLGWVPGDWLDDDHLIANLHGGTLNGTSKVYSMCRLVLVTLSTASAEPMVPLLGGVAGDYYTAAVRKLK